MTHNYHYVMGSHNHNPKTLRCCKVCGEKIRSHNWINRLPENKVLLCESHLKSKLRKERNHNAR